MIRKISVMMLCTILFIVGCDNIETRSDNKIDILQAYLDVRYDALTADNFSEKVDEMLSYYSDNLKNSDDWVINPTNLDNTYMLLQQDEILAEILYEDIIFDNEDTYEANIIIKYNTKDIQNTYCVEYTFEVTFDGDKIDSFEKTDMVIAFVGEGEVVIENGNVIVTTEPCDEGNCTHEHTNEPS